MAVLSVGGYGRDIGTAWLLRTSASSEVLLPPVTMSWIQSYSVLSAGSAAVRDERVVYCDDVCGKVFFGPVEAQGLSSGRHASSSILSVFGHFSRTLLNPAAIVASMSGSVA